MAVVNPPAWLSARTDHTAELMRRMLASGLVTPGVPSIGNDKLTGECAVTQQGSPIMGVTVLTGDVLVQCFNTADGYYHVFNDASTNLAIGASDPSNPRHDLVVMRVRDQEQSGVTNSADLFVVQGTAAASPVDPALPAGASYEILARVNVGAAATQVLNANIDDLRKKAVHTGGLYVCTSTTRPSAPGRGDLIFETDTAVVLLWNGSAWKPYAGGLPDPVVTTATSNDTITATTFADLPTPLSVNFVTPYPVWVDVDYGAYFALATPSGTPDLYLAIKGSGATTVADPTTPGPDALYMQDVTGQTLFEAVNGSRTLLLNAGTTTFVLRSKKTATVTASIRYPHLHVKPIKWA